MNRNRANFASSTRRRRRRAAAFTLVEVLATLLLLGIALPAVMEGFFASTAAMNTATRQAEAYSLAQSQLQYLITTGAWQNTSQGTVDGANPDNHYQWSTQLSTFGTGLGVNGSNIVQELDLQLTWTERSSVAPKTVTVSTLVYQSSNTTGSSSSASGGIR